MIDKAVEILIILAATLMFLACAIWLCFVVYHDIKLMYLPECSYF